MSLEDGIKSMMRSHDLKGTWKALKAKSGDLYCGTQKPLARISETYCVPGL